jgi:hypothetical protein
MKLYGFIVLFFGAISLYATPYDALFARAGADFGIEPSLLARIATIESSMNPNALGKNTNGTVDIGLMQINSMHLKRLAKVGVTRESLRDPEVNIYVAALLLSSHIKRRGYNLQAIGCYHSGNAVYKNQWLKRLAMAQIPQGSSDNIGGTSSLMGNRGISSSGDDPRSRFAQAQLAQKIDEKIALGMNPKLALREAKEEVNRLMGYSS